MNIDVTEILQTANLPLESVLAYINLYGCNLDISSLKASRQLPNFFVQQVRHSTFQITTSSEEQHQRQARFLTSPQVNSQSFWSPKSARVTENKRYDLSDIVSTSPPIIPHTIVLSLHQVTKGASGIFHKSIREQTCATLSIQQSASQRLIPCLHK